MLQKLIAELAEKYAFTEEDTARVAALMSPSLASHAGALTYVPDTAVLPLDSETPLRDPTDRYQPLALLGRGGMGEVHRVWDRVLNRAVAMKVIQPALSRRSSSVLRFEEEARLTAQLQHPGIVAVYDLGRLLDGRLFITMEEVSGETLAMVLTREESVRRLLDLLQRSGEAIAFAHGHGILHRDIKPSNIMVTGYADIKLLDWGLAGRQDPLPGQAHHAPVAPRSPSSYPGTPIYMAPELFQGEPPTEACDVYALGVLLYQMIADRLPFPASSFAAQQQRISQQQLSPPPLPRSVPATLAGLCLAAMAPDPAQRPSAVHFAKSLKTFLVGDEQRAAALELVEASEDTLDDLLALQADAADRAAESKTFLADVPRWAPVEQKRAGWAMADSAAELGREAIRTEAQYIEQLQRALITSPNLPEAHERLARWYRDRLEEAEQQGDEEATIRALSGLEAHDRGRHQRYLSGEGALTLHTDPPGATVTLHRFETVDRRMIPDSGEVIGQTPLSEHPLPMGSYLLTIDHPDCDTVRYPVWITRQHHWDGVPPGHDAPMPVPLPRKGVLGPDDVYVPAGWFWRGQDPQTNARHHGRLWVDGVVFRRFPVTAAEYLDFLNALVEAGREDEAAALIPAMPPDELKAPAVLRACRGPDGRYRLEPNRHSPAWDPDWPIAQVTWDQAQAYCEWMGGGWRLPGEWEWEKAARGVDRRAFPWGSHGDEAWACTRHSHEDDIPRPVPVRRYPTDASVYGVRCVGGGISVWCGDADIWGAPTPGRRSQVPDPSDPSVERLIRGASWNEYIGRSRVTWRHFRYRSGYGATLGFRLVRSF